MNKTPIRIISYVAFLGILFFCINHTAPVYSIQNDLLFSTNTPDNPYLSAPESTEHPWLFAIPDAFAFQAVSPKITRQAISLVREHINSLNNCSSVPPHIMRKILNMHNLESHNANSINSARTIGESVGAHIVVAGYIKKDKGGFGIGLQLIETQTGNLLHIEQRTCGKRERDIEFAIRGIIDNFYLKNEKILTQNAARFLPKPESKYAYSDYEKNSMSETYETSENNTIEQSIQSPLSHPIISTQIASAQDLPTAINTSTSTFSASEITISSSALQKTILEVSNLTHSTHTASNGNTNVITPSANSSSQYAVLDFAPIGDISQEKVGSIIDQLVSILRDEHSLPIFEKDSVPHSEISSDNHAISIGKNINASYVIVGSCADFYDSIFINVRVLDVQKNSTLYTHQATILNNEIPKFANHMAKGIKKETEG